ncbi:MAG: response regulator transcription factor [Cyanobacteria bacterium P01_A01_bin.3]
MTNQRVSSSTSPIRVLVVDDQKMMRAIFKDYVSSADDIVVVGTAQNGKQGVEQAFSLEPDVVLMDIEMPQMDGIAATRMLFGRKSKAKVLVVSTSYDDRYLAQALRNGASGYLLKTTTPEELVSAIRGVHEGSLQFGRGVLQRELSSLAPGGNPAEPDRKVKAPDPAEALKNINRVTNGASLLSGASSSETEAYVAENGAFNGNGNGAKTLERVGDNSVPRANTAARVNSVSQDNSAVRTEATSKSSRELETELSRIRAAYWVLKTEQKKMHRWLEIVSFIGAGALAILFLLVCLAVV